MGWGGAMSDDSFNLSLGFFDSEEEADLAWDRAMIIVYGDEAETKFSPEFSAHITFSPEIMRVLKSARREMPREVKRRDPDTGHVIKEYYGSPMAWMAQFTGGRRLARFKLGG
jgi:hypothetical protein